MAQIKASASIKFKISFLNSLTLFFITVLLLDRSGSRTNRGPRRKPPAFPSWLKTLLIPVAVVLSLGGNLYYKCEDNAGGTAHRTIPAIPLKLAPEWAIHVKIVSFIDMHLIEVPSAMSKALTIMPTRNPYKSHSHIRGTVKMTNVIVPQFPNKAIVLASQLGKAVSEDSAIGPQVFQTVHCMKDNKEKRPKINHLRLYTFKTTFLDVMET